MQNREDAPTVYAGINEQNQEDMENVKNMNFEELSTILKQKNLNQDQRLEELKLAAITYAIHRLDDAIVSNDLDTLKDGMSKIFLYLPYNSPMQQSFFSDLVIKSIQNSNTKAFATIFNENYGCYKVKDIQAMRCYEYIQNDSKFNQLFLRWWGKSKMESEVPSQAQIEEQIRIQSQTPEERKAELLEKITSVFDKGKNNMKQILEEGQKKKEEGLKKAINENLSELRSKLEIEEQQKPLEIEAEQQQEVPAEEENLQQFVPNYQELITTDPIVLTLYISRSLIENKNVIKHAKDAIVFPLAERLSLYDSKNNTEYKIQNVTESLPDFLDSDYIWLGTHLSLNVLLTARVYKIAKSTNPEFEVSATELILPSMINTGSYYFHSYAIPGMCSAFDDGKPINSITDFGQKCSIPTALGGLFGGITMKSDGKILSQDPYTASLGVASGAALGGAVCMASHNHNEEVSDAVFYTSLVADSTFIILMDRSLATPSNNIGIIKKLFFEFAAFVFIHEVMELGLNELSNFMPNIFEE